MVRPDPPYESICGRLRTRRGAEGELVAVFLDPRLRPLLTATVGEGMDNVDELFLRHLEAMVADMEVAAVLFAVSRMSGSATRLDRLLWRELKARLASSPTELVDLLVVGETRYWSAASRRSYSFAATSAAAR
jgi:DNA repair protein RadC